MFTHDQKVYSTCDFDVVLTLLLHTILRGTDNAAYWTVPFLITFRSFTYCESFQVRLFFCRTFVRQFLRTQLTGASRGPSAIADPLNDTTTDTVTDLIDVERVRNSRLRAIFGPVWCSRSFLANVNSLHVRYLLSPVRPSVVCLSSVCNARAPYSVGSNFRQHFYGISYLGHPLTSTEIFTEIVPGEPLRRGS